MINNITRRFKRLSFLAWFGFWLCLTLASLNGLQYGVYKFKLRDNQNHSNKIIWEVITNSDALILEEKARVSALEAQILELNKKTGIFLSMKDAGFDAHSVEDITAILELLEKAPYGSPFVDGHSVTSNWGTRVSPISGLVHEHKGVDLVSKGSWRVIATADGEIVDYGYSEMYGKYVVFETTGGYRIKYAHLSKIFWLDLDNKLVKGVKVPKGTQLGVMGSTGQSTGPHLHYEVSVYNGEVGGYVHLEPEEIIEYLGGK